MTLLVTTYLIYLAISFGFTVWVGLTLSRNGRIFLIDVFKGDERIADAVNHLLVVGFYLVNFGFVTWFLRTSTTVAASSDVFNVLSVKIGTVLLVLGGLHMLNVFIFTRMRRERTPRPQPVFAYGPPLPQIPTQPQPRPNPANGPDPR